VRCAKIAEPIEMLFGTLSPVYPRNHVLHGGTDAPWEWAILRGRARPDMPNNTLTWTVQKQLNLSRHHLRYELRWAQGSTY